MITSSDVILTLLASWVQVLAMVPVLPETTVLKALTIPLSALQEPRVLALARLLSAIALCVMLEVNSALKETLPLQIATPVTSAPLKLPSSQLNGVALQVNGPQLVLLMPPLDAQTVPLVNGAEKVLSLRLLIKIDAKLLTTSALLEKPDLSLALLVISSTLQQVEMCALLALPVATAPVCMANLNALLVGNQLAPRPFVPHPLPVLPPLQDRVPPPEPKLPMASGMSLDLLSVTRPNALEATTARLV